MPDEMFFSPDERGLVRGRRGAARTETCRPCLFLLEDGRELQGVILNLNAHGVLVRLMEPLPIGTAVDVQMMRDESFTKALSAPRHAKVVRLDAADGTFFDVGIKFDAGRAIRRKEPTPRAAKTRPAAPQPKEPSRMQTLDVMLDNPRRNRRR